jgi:hypothetical protein
MLHVNETCRALRCNRYLPNKQTRDSDETRMTKEDRISQ